MSSHRAADLGSSLLDAIATERPGARTRSTALMIVLLLYLGLGAAYSVVVPIFEAPDETSHFAYARYLAETGSLPVQDAKKPGPFGQEGSQPPLYYSLVALLIRPIDMRNAGELMWNNPQNVMGHPTVPGNKNRFVHTAAEQFPYRGAALAVHLGRLVSLLLGAGTVGLTFLIGQQVFRSSPNRRLAAAAAVCVAFLPQFLFIHAAVNNDAAVALFSTATLYFLLRLVHEPVEPDFAWRTGDGRKQLGLAAALGTALGLALLSKLSALLLLPFVLVVLAFFSWRRNAAGRYGRLTLVILSVTFLVAAWWFARNIWLYGDPIAANVTSAIAARRSFHLDTYLGGAWAEFRGLRWSFWGLFGWFSLLLPTPVYAVLDLLTVVALAGLVVAGWRARQHTERERQVAGRHLASGLWGGALVLLSVWLLVVFAGLVWWTTQTKGAHGRLLFPAISSLAVLLVAGWSAWLPGRLRAAMPVLVGVPLLVFAVWALAGVIQPAYARPPLVDVSAIPPAAQHSPIAFGQPDSGGRIRLLGVSVDPTDATPGETVRLTFYWQAMEPITRDTLLNVRLFGHDLALLVNEDTYPGWGSYPPSLWPVGPVVVDRYRFQLPAHVDAPTLVRVDVGFAERWTGDRWPAVDAQGQQLGEPVAVAAIRLHNATAGAELVGEPVAWLADGIILLNSQLVGAQPGKAGMDKLSLVAGDDVVVALEWTAEQAPSRDYTVFVHLLNHQGEIVTQADGPPRSGDFPTSAWRPGDRVPDRRLLTIPPNTPAGDYNLAAGMYEPDTLDRLPARDSANEPWPENAVRLRTVHLSQPTNVDTSP